MTTLARLMNCIHRIFHGTDAFPNPVNECVQPYVGMQLCCPKWGKDWAVIEIIRVALNGTDVMYKHVISQGVPYTSTNSNRDTPNQSWKEFSTKRYTIIPKEENVNV